MEVLVFTEPSAPGGLGVRGPLRLLVRVLRGVRRRLPPVPPLSGKLPLLLRVVRLAALIKSLCGLTSLGACLHLASVDGIRPQKIEGSESWTSKKGYAGERTRRHEFAKSLMTGVDGITKDFAPDRLGEWEDTGSTGGEKIERHRTGIKQVFKRSLSMNLTIE